MKAYKVALICVCVCVCSEITESGQLRLQSVSKDERRFIGAGADRLEIKEFKIDRHSEKFKDCSKAVF